MSSLTINYGWAICFNPNHSIITLVLLGNELLIP